MTDNERPNPSTGIMKVTTITESATVTLKMSESTEDESQYLTKGQPDWRETDRGRAALSGDRPRLSRTLWERPARELLTAIQANRVEIQSTEAVVLLGDLRAALEDVDIPEDFR